MPQLISASSSVIDPNTDSDYASQLAAIQALDIEGLIYYTLVGTNDFRSTIDWWVDQEAIRDDIDLELNFLDVYDGYTLTLQNLYIAWEMSEENDHDLICLMAEEACNCVICMGIYYDATEEEVLPTARYYEANEFLQYYLGNTEEPESVSIPEYDDGLNNKYFAKNIDTDWDADDILVGTVGESYEVWRFQPRWESSYENYGYDYRFQPDDLVKTFLWTRDSVTDDSTDLTTVTDHWQPAALTEASLTEVTVMYAQSLIFSMGVIALGTMLN